METPAAEGRVEEQFQQERQSCIGGSDVAPILGVHSPGGRSIIDVYLDKIGEAPPREVSDDMEFGLVAEAYALRVYAKRMGVKVLPGGFRRHPDFPFIGGHADGIVEGHGVIVEAKSVRFEMMHLWGAEYTDEIPDPYILQGQQYMMVYGLREVDYPVVMGRAVKFYHLEHSDSLATLMLEEEEKFWKNHVEKRVPPPVDGSVSYERYLKSMFPKNTEPYLKSDLMMDFLMAQRVIGTRILKAMEEKLQRIDNELIKRIGPHAGIEGPGYKIHYKMSNPKKFLDMQALMAHYHIAEGELEQFCRESTTINRPFSPKPTKTFDEEAILRSCLELVPESEWLFRKPQQIEGPHD